MSVSTITANTHTNHVRSKKQKPIKQPTASPQPPKHSIRTVQNGRPDEQNNTYSTPQRPARTVITPVTAPPVASTAPPNTKKDLNHLVGRPLVPFYLADGVENTELSCVDDQREWGKTADGKQVKVRQFVDGYFVNSGTIGQSDSEIPPTSQTNPTISNSTSGTVNNRKQPSSTSTKAPPSYATVAATPVKGQKKAAVAIPIATPVTKVDTVSRPQRFAAPAFNNSPSPLTVPLPKFLSASKPTMPSTDEEPSTSDQSVTKTASHISLADKFQSQPSNRQLQQSVDSSSPSAPTHDVETSLPLSLMHLVNSAPAISSHSHIVPPDSFPIHSPELPIHQSFPQSLPVSQATTGDAPKLLFLRQSSAGGQEAVVTQVHLASVPSAHPPAPGFQQMPIHYSGAVHTRPFSQQPIPHFVPSHSVGSANPMHVHSMLPHSFHHQASVAGHGHYAHPVVQQPAISQPTVFNPYATGPVPLHHLPPSQHLFQPELAEAVQHLSLMRPR